MDQILKERGHLGAYRRLHDRYLIAAGGTLHLSGESEKRVAVVKDISFKGVGIISNGPLTIGEEVRVVIQAPFIKDLEQEKSAMVVWSRPLAENLWQAGLCLNLNNVIEFA